MPKKTGELIEFLFHSLPETNITPEKKPSQKETAVPIVHFQVLCYFQGRYKIFPFFGGSFGSLVRSGPKVDPCSFKNDTKECNDHHGYDCEFERDLKSLPQNYYFCLALDRIFTCGFFLDSSPKVLDSSNRVFRALLRGLYAAKLMGDKHHLFF